MGAGLILGGMLMQNRTIPLAEKLRPQRTGHAG